MLREIVRTIAEGQVHSQVELARWLGVSEGLVEQMLEDLARTGYLKPMGGESTEGCAGCPLAKMCVASRPRRAWVLTEKGRKVAEGEYN